MEDVEELCRRLHERGAMPPDAPKFLERIYCIPVPAPGETVSVPTLSSVLANGNMATTACLRFRRDVVTALSSSVSLLSNRSGNGDNRLSVGIAEEEAVNCILRWCAPIMFSLLDSMDVIRLLGAVLTENKVCETMTAAVLCVVHVCDACC